MMEATERAIANENVEHKNVEGTLIEKKRPKTAKKKFKKFGVNDILESACWNPENFEDWSEWSKQRNANPMTSIEHYPGVRRYDIQVHCVQFVIRAKKHPNGGYQILDYFRADH